jgi:3-dehydroquinate synthetase
VRLENADVDAVIEAIRRDKKRIGADVPFVLVRGPGEVSFGCEVSGDEVRAAVMELAA